VDFDWDAPVPPATRLPRLGTAALRATVSGVSRLLG
jgi:hypothetical protein